MKVLVMGAGGMAGHVIAIRLAQLGHKVVGFARRELPFCNTIVADVRSADALNDTLKTNDFDAIVNAIGILPNAINGNIHEVIYINAFLPHLLANLTAGTKTKIIHLSTDCVFSGHDNGNYSEKSFCNANDYYGRSKALGELIDDKNLTFRMSIIGPDINKNGTGLFNWFMHQSGEVQGFNKAIWTGVTTIALADAIDAALSQKLTGLYHLVNNKTITKFELLKLFNELRNEPIIINKNDKYAVDKSLVNTRNDFIFNAPSYEEMIESMKQWIHLNNNYYLQYKLK